MNIPECEVKFEIICKTAFGEQLIIVGNTPQLGQWDPFKGIVMKTDDDNYPNWYTENPLMLEKGQKFQFKFVKLKQGINSQEWEEFPNNLNRKYRTRYISVTLKAIWNEFSGREVTNKKYASSNVFSNDEIKVHKFKISGLFVPYEQAGTDSSSCSDPFEEKKIEEHIEYNNKNYNNDSDHSAPLVKKKLHRGPFINTGGGALQQQQNNQFNLNQGMFSQNQQQQQQNSPNNRSQNNHHHNNFNQHHQHHNQQYQHEELELYSPAIHSSSLAAGAGASAAPSHPLSKQQININYIKGNPNNKHTSSQQQSQQQQIQLMNHNKQFNTDEQIKSNAILQFQQQSNQDTESNDSKQLNNSFRDNISLNHHSNHHHNNPAHPLKLPQKNKKNNLLELDQDNQDDNNNSSVKSNELLDDQQSIKNQAHPSSAFKNYSQKSPKNSDHIDSSLIYDKNISSHKKDTKFLKLIGDHKFNDDIQQNDEVLSVTQNESVTIGSPENSVSEKISITEKSDNLSELMKKNRILPKKKKQQQLVQKPTELDIYDDNQSLADSQSNKIIHIQAMKLANKNEEDDEDEDGLDSDENDEEEEEDFEIKEAKITGLHFNKNTKENSDSLLFGSSSQNNFRKINSLSKVGGTNASLSNKSEDGQNTNIHSETSLQSHYFRKQKRSPTQQEIIFAEKLFQSSGHTLQTLFQDRIKQISQTNLINQKYSFITSENDIVFEASEEFLVNMSEKDELCLATFFLPIIVTYDAATDTLKDEIQESSMYYHFINSYPSLRWVGVLPNYSQIPSHLYERVTNNLISKYRFYPIFMENEMIDSFLNHFCYNTYDNIMTNQFDLQHYRYIEYNPKMVEEVKMISFRFAQQISKMIDDDTNIMIADYKIIFAIIYISQCRAKKLSIAYFHDSQFPDIDKLQILPFGEKLINAILCANLISFMNFECAQNFLKYIRIKLKLPYESIRGNLRLIYMGNQIIIHIRNPGVNIKAITHIRSSQYFEDSVENIKKTQINQDNKILVLSVDTLHENNKIELKFKLFERLLQNHTNLKIQLIQIILPEQKSYSKLGFYSNVELQKNINKIANDIQKNFKSRNPLLVMYQNMPLKERLEYMQIADIFLKTSVLQENEIYPFEYILANQKHGFCLINKFGSSNYKQMRSCIPFNPSSYYEFEKNLLEIHQLSQSLKEKVVTKDVDILCQFNTSIWIEKHIAELKKNARFMSQANMTGFNKGINFKKVAHQANFRQLNVKEASELYRKSVRRLLIFGYAGTLVPLDKYMYIQAEEHQVRRHHQKPSLKIIDNLKKLCADKKNMVYIVTEMSIDFMDEWFSDVPGLGLICENGYFHKVIQEGGKPNTEWLRLVDIDMSWKEPVYRIMESYAVRTQGSSVEMKESSVVWKYNKVSIDFGSKQAEQMIQQLNLNISQLKYLEISHNNESVEVKPTNLNKGIVAELLIQRKIVECGKIDFILILGSSMTDEDMICACQMFYRNHNKEFQEKFKPLYVTIGIKPSNAYYYIAYEEVEKVMELLVYSETFASFV